MLERSGDFSSVAFSLSGFTLSPLSEEKSLTFSKLCICNLNPKNLAIFHRQRPDQTTAQVDPGFLYSENLVAGETFSPFKHSAFITALSAPPEAVFRRFKAFSFKRDGIYCPKSHCALKTARINPLSSDKGESVKPRGC